MLAKLQELKLKFSMTTGCCWSVDYIQTELCDYDCANLIPTKSDAHWCSCHHVASSATRPRLSQTNGLYFSGRNYENRIFPPFS
jgi:hypothetical protein